MHLGLLPILVAQSVPTLQFDGSQFLITVEATTVTAPIKQPLVKPGEQVLFRKDETYAVWDSRGLTVRRGDKAHSTRMEDVSLTPKLFSAEQIGETKKLLDSKKRSRGANALSGAKRISNLVYFLLRWEDSSGDPWIEALVKVDLDGESLKPEFIGAFEGLSLAEGLIDDRLDFAEGVLTVVTRRADGTWGLASFDPSASEFKFAQMGRGLMSFLDRPNRSGLYQERSAHGTVLAGRANLALAKRSDLMEVSAPVDWLILGDKTVARFVERGEIVLRNAEEASEKRLPQNTGIALTSLGVVVWRPEAKPTEAALLEPERWTVLARWSAPKSGR